MRFAVRISYNGTSYSGWQSQPNAPTVQEEIEKAIFKKYRKEIKILGCCRTDKGVHAKDFLFHFDFETDIRDNFIYILNKLTSENISINGIERVSDDFHARFDAISRTYTYLIHTKKNPFKGYLSYYFPYLLNADLDKMNKAASLLLQYDEFYPFCKTNSDVNTMICKLKNCNWRYDEELGDFSFEITSDRFLRGMVRLIVGMSINIGLQKLTLREVELALNNQVRLPLDLSVPAHGLYLDKIVY